MLILFGIISFLIQIYVSIRRRDALRDRSGDSWGGRTLEWSTDSPPPDYNFAFTPVVHDNDAWWDMKQRGFRRPVTGFNAIHMPRNTGAGFILALFSGIFGFAMIWHIWWLAALGLVAVLAAAIVHSFNYQRDFHIPAAEVARTESERTRLLAAPP